MENSNSLTAKLVEQHKTPGVYGDGAGLLLRVERNGAKRWVLRTTASGKRRDIGLGSARDISLADVCDAAADLRKLARSGQDPVAHRGKSKKAQLTFAAAAEKMHAQNKASRRNGKHVAQWITTLRTYAFPVIDKMPVGEIQTKIEATADCLRSYARLTTLMCKRKYSAGNAPYINAEWPQHLSPPRAALAVPYTAAICQALRVGFGGLSPLPACVVSWIGGGSPVARLA